MQSCEKATECGLAENCKYREEVQSKTAQILQPKAIVSNLAQALDAIGEANNTRNQGFSLFYRGHSSADYHLKPSVYREIPGTNAMFVEFEDKMFKEMLARHPDEFAQCKTTVEKLAIMQHYDLPTRLLDVTENPLIALFFACSDGKEDKPGMFFTFSIKSNMIKYVDSDTVSIIANLAKMPKDFDVRDISNINKSEAGRRLVHEIGEEKPYFIQKIKSEHLDNYVICVKARRNSPRIIAQQGSFLLFGIQKSKMEGSYFWTKQGGNDPLRKISVQHFCIPKQNKKNILKELNILNINESTVFPEMVKSSKYVKDNIFTIFGDNS